MSIAINIAPDGKIVMLKSEVSDELHGDDYNSTRVSYVEPVNPLLRWGFYLIRNRVSDDSWLAGFTRKWRCKWQSNLHPVGGPVLGNFSKRQDAIDAEIAWLLVNVFDLDAETLEGILL
jgi:hypothetical protein